MLLPARLQWLIPLSFQEQVLKDQASHQWRCAAFHQWLPFQGSVSYARFRGATANHGLEYAYDLPANERLFRQLPLPRQSQRRQGGRDHILFWPAEELQYDRYSQTTLARIGHPSIGKQQLFLVDFIISPSKYPEDLCFFSLDTYCLGHQ